jgi:formylglycine-generating enzyme required for sulfatase activity
MSDFDPYYQWLGIPLQEQPASHYRLLGIPEFDGNVDIIKAGAERQTIYLRTLQAGEHEVLVAELLNEVSQARVTLLNADQKAEYDEELRKQQTPEPVPEPTLPPIPVVQTPAPTPVVVRGTVTQEFPVSVVQPAKRARRRKPQQIWKRPAVIGVSVVGVIGVLALLMFSGDADPVASNVPPVVTSPPLTSPEPVPAQATANTLPASLQEGLIAYYPFNGNAQDESGNGNHGEVHGAVLNSDRHGNTDQAYLFDGVDDYIKCPSIFEKFYPLSLSTWIKAKGPYPNTRFLYCILSKPRADRGSGFKLSITEDSIYAGHHLGGPVIDEYVQGILGKWHSFTLTNNGTHMSLFHNGVKVEVRPMEAFVEVRSLNVLIGTEFQSFEVNRRSFKGSIDDIRIYNRALSEAEVKSLYEYESKPPASPIPTAPAIESITNTIGMKLNKIPAGTFMMGSPATETDRQDNEHQHPVTISKAFYMQTTEVTQGQWKEVMGTEPWKGKGDVKEGPNYAAAWISWNDAVAYCKKLSEKEGKTYRLPTEAEWEYACRAGTETTWSFGDDQSKFGQYAWYGENAWAIDEKYAHQVRLKKSNAFGLYDMHGNVWEWCHDYFDPDYYKQSPEQDPQGAASGSRRVYRGGTWFSDSRDARSALRGSFGAGYSDSDFGFRVVRELDDSSQSTPPPLPPTAPAIESITNTIGMTLNEIPAGTFMMGSPEGEEGRQDNETQHKVTISKAFYMQTAEVTQGQWKEVMGTEPWKGKGNVKEGPNYAASHVSWNDAVAYCETLSEKEGNTYRLPTEAEWEYACRAGTETTWSFGDDEKALGDYAWYQENAWDIDEKYAHQVGQKKSNAFGLYDMHGNVFEWCNDYFEEDYYKQSPEKDPTGPTSGSFRVLRGGSWPDRTRGTRSARRFGIDADRYGSSGFRLVRELDDSNQSTPPPVPPPAPAIESITNTLDMTFNKIPAGTFLMGSPENEEGREDDEHQHKVTISKAFYMQTTEVTQGQWQAVMGTEPWKGNPDAKMDADHPAVNVSWGAALQFCSELGKQEEVEYRLPTEAEWEYACRAGTTTMYSFGNDVAQLGQYAWHKKNASAVGEGHGQRVGQKLPNPWGLYDMHGNVWEWCQDLWGSYGEAEIVSDPVGMHGRRRVLRGGSFQEDGATFARSANRDGILLPGSFPTIGFRVVRVISQ